MPSQAELERMAGEAFNLADADSDSYVRLDEWVSWGRRVSFLVHHRRDELPSSADTVHGYRAALRPWRRRS